MKVRQRPPPPRSELARVGRLLVYCHLRRRKTCPMSECLAQALLRDECLMQQCLRVGGLLISSNPVGTVSQLRRLNLHLSVLLYPMRFA